MAKSVKVSWVLPTTRKSTLPLNPADIALVELALSVDGVTFVAYDSFAPPVLETVVPDLEIGKWYVQGVVVDTAGQKSDPIVESIEIKDDSPPGTLTLTLAFA